MFSLAVTLGNLWFSTTNTVMPLGKVKMAGSLNEITGALPGLGGLLLSIGFWANTTMLTSVPNKRLIYCFMINQFIICG